MDATVTAGTGFTARIVVLPGKLYDPLWMIPHNGSVWFNDDGGEKGDFGGRMMAIDRQGNLTVLADIGTLPPITGWDFVPKSFGAFSGQLLALTQARAGKAGIYQNHVVRRFDPGHNFAATILCTLPNAGKSNKGVPGTGSDARFGPEGSPFSGRFFGVTALNRSIYQVTLDGVCRPFINFDATNFTRPVDFAFADDGKEMLVTVIGAKKDAAGAVVRVGPDGKLKDTFMKLPGGVQPWGVAVAPKGFGRYGGQVFVTVTNGGGDADVDISEQSLEAGGQVLRIARDGSVHVVALGFHLPVSIQFIDSHTLWIGDVNGDYISGGSHERDGFIVEIHAK